ncbi:hypothetical protein C7S16_3754 [Burkholderia thailandensis]|uniref:Uncharacterized protein n=1 Tax=Burkholderia thailandensis TaxID=57975 RepID=A0AAW9CZM4_BURTH|nr:hypothetical protein [Burkholderia thailandensis]MDW9255366.1 hypothetical protein [Burkholderia thailandensis]
MAAGVRPFDRQSSPSAKHSCGAPGSRRTARGNARVALYLGPAWHAASA